MGKFSAVYDIVGGEQMLIVVMCDVGAIPFYQIVTEIDDVQTIIEMPVINDPENVQKTTNAAIKRMGVAFLEEVTMENLLEIRKLMVLELKRQKFDTLTGGATLKKQG